MFPMSISDAKIDQIKRRPGKQVLKEYENLDPDKEWLIECYRRAIIEKYAEEIGYKQ